MDLPYSTVAESSRVAALRQYSLVDAPPATALQDLVELAAAVCQAPIAFIAFVDETRQRVTVSTGLDPFESPRTGSFGSLFVGRAEPLAIEDARHEPRLAEDPLFVGPVHARCYAGAPLLAPGRHAIGVLGVADPAVRSLTDAQLRTLVVLSRRVMTELEVRRQAEILLEGEGRWQRALDAAHMGTFDWDMVGGDITWSRGHEAIWGMAPGTFDGRYETFARRVHPDDIDGINAEVARCAAVQAPWEREFRVVWPDGSVRWVLGRGEFDLKGATPVRMRGVVQDITARRMSADAARENEERFREAQREAGIGSWRYLPNGTLVWSEQTYELLPVPRGVPLTYERALDVMHPDDRADRYATGFEHALRSGARDYRADYRVVWPDGQVRTMHSRGTIHRDAAGELIEAIGTVQDVTERRAAEARIRQLNRAYAMLGGISETLVRENDPAAALHEACRIAVDTGGFRMAWIGLMDEHGRLRISAHAGADAEALAIIDRLLDIATPAGCRFTAEALRLGHRAICNNIATSADAAGWRDDALRRHYRSMASLPLVRDGRPIGVFNIYAAEPDVFDEPQVRLLDDVASDISFALEVFRRDVERRQAEERFRLVVENIREVFLIVNASGRLEFISPAYETIWGRPREPLEAHPQAWLETVHADDRARMEEMLRTQLLTGATDETYRIVRPDGSVRWIRSRSFPVHGADGRLERIVGTSADVTEQRQLEEQFRQSQKMESVGRLAGGIAHDFNNLLTVINGTAELAAIDLPRESAMRRDLLQIRQAGERAAALTRQLLALSRQHILKPAIINLTSVVRGMQSMLRRLISENVQLAFRFDDSLGHIKADPSQIEQVILNLAVNAQDAMADGGTLTIETGQVYLDVAEAANHLAPRAGAYAMLAVSDTGIGMDDATRQRIFEPFFTTKEIGKGTGLGLSTVYGIVQQSDGGLFVYSEPGHGTTVKTYLPLVDEPPPAMPPLEGADQSGTETILLVEDEPALRLLTKRILSSAGYTVLDAERGDDALALLAAHPGPVHLLLTDVVMPGMNGRELATRVTALRPAIRILFASGYTDDTIFRHGVLDDGSRFISKPYAPGELRRKIREALS